MSRTNTEQQSFTTPIERSKEVLRRVSQIYDPNHIILAVSGGTDSVVAADVMARLGPEFDLTPTAVAHINTGASIPQTELAARIIADIHDLQFIKQGYRNQRNSIGWRVLEQGWPAAYGGHPTELGHGREWANRKNKPMDAVYMMFDGFEMWVSGARKLESGKRQGNVPDSGFEEDKPRRVWVQVIGGWTEAEKQRYIKQRGLPVSESYLLLGFSGECTACSFDNQGLLTGIDLLAPELSHAIRTVALWLYQRVKRGDVDLEPKRLCWGWEPDQPMEIDKDESTAQEMVGCDPESCGSDIDDGWIKELPANQLVSREDVLEWWDTGDLPTRFPV
jgi:3'-phosphoadenosine 5'-phosphosulfate sulfotransferase (PAPS reductase)/FAD synthetase